MSLFNKVALIALITAVPMSSATAADLITYPTSTDEVLPVAEDTSYDWNGFYAGVYGVGQFGPVSGNQYGGGLAVGVNAQFDFYLLGAEVAYHGLTAGAGNTSYGQILAKGGLVVTDNILLYAAGGYGIDLGPPDESHILLGGGAEVAVTENVSLRAQYLHGFPVTGDNPIDQVTIGANFHF